MVYFGCKTPIRGPFEWCSFGEPSFEICGLRLSGKRIEMRNRTLLREAEDCRRKARELHGKRDAAILLRIAKAFEQLASERKCPRE